ncbi:MAG: TrmH family RNA methyltransferase [Brevefilum sp.]
MISSSNNTKIKLVRSLQGRSRQRKAENAFIAEGVRLVEEAVDEGWPIEFVLFDESLSERGMALINNLKSEGDISISQIAPELMAEITDTETPQGILAVLKRWMLPIPDSPTLILIADQIRDPGNMGTLLRTAEAARVDAVILSPGTVDAFSPKVVRAAMGAHFRLPIHEHNWEEIQSVVKNLTTFQAESGDGVPLWHTDFSQPLALLIGGEAFGATKQGRSLATQKVTIPMPGRAESLNAAVAAGILIAEVLRQRYSL